MNVVVAPPVDVKPLDEEWTARWDAFVQSHPEATFFHLSGWKRVIEDGFGHACHFLLAEQGGAVRGVLPLVHVASRLFGNALISNAFCVYGGPVCADEAARLALDRAAIELAEALKADHLEYRLRTPAHDDWARKSDLYFTFRKQLDPDPEKNLAAIPRKRRAVIRKGLGLGLHCELESGVDRFFALYGTSVRDLGTPVFAKRYFRRLKEVFGDACEILTVVHDGRPLSSLITFYFRDEVLPYYGGGVGDAKKLAAHEVMYWDVMRRACQSGYRVFDFGRSKRETGPFTFKKLWGFEPEPLHYEYKLIGRDEVPDINPLNPKYRLYINAWRRLPLPVANLIGPFLSRNLG